jgi:hypothetical protein
LCTSFIHTTVTRSCRVFVRFVRRFRSTRRNIMAVRSGQVIARLAFNIFRNGQFDI